MSTATSPIFRPSQPVIDEVLAHCADSALTLPDIALRHSTTLEALTLFITRTDIAERLDTLHALAASRARLIAANLIPMALDALTRVLRDSETEDNADAAAPPDKKRSPELRLRARETARRAATRILTLSTFNPPRLFGVERPWVARDPLDRVARAARPPVVCAGPAPDSSPPPPAQDAPAPASTHSSSPTPRRHHCPPSAHIIPILPIPPPPTSSTPSQAVSAAFPFSPFPPPRATTNLAAPAPRPASSTPQAHSPLPTNTGPDHAEPPR